MMRALVALVLFVLLSAGCAGSSDGPEPTTGPIEGTGELRGLATDEEFLPLPGVSVSFTTSGGRLFATQTGQDGGYVIEKVPPGRFEVSADKLGYVGATRDVTMLPGQDRRLDFELTAVGSLVEPYNSTITFRGRYECGLDALGSGKSCDAVLRDTAGEEVFSTQNNHSFALASGWGGVLLEVDWSAATGDDLIDGVRLIIGSEANGSILVRASGPDRPMRVLLNATEVHPGGDGAPLPAPGGALWARIEPLGASGPECPVGDCPSVGGGLELEYALHVTTYFNSRVDATYTAVPPE